jgi:hypothetical protein
MSKLMNIAVGDEIGVVISGRRTTTTSRMRVTKVTAKTLVAIPVSQGTWSVPITERFNRETGYAVGRLDKQACPVEDEAFVKAEAAYHEVLRIERQKGEDERNARDRRYGTRAASRGDEEAFQALDSLALTATRIRETLQRRLDYVTPTNFHRELGWLEQSAAKSVELEWYDAMLKAAGERPDGTPIQNVFTEYRDSALQKLRYSSSLPVLIGSRDAAEVFDSVLRYRFGPEGATCNETTEPTEETK